MSALAADFRVAEHPVLTAALAYAAAGYPVFPCRGKRPATANGFKDATTNEAQIRAWWHSIPHNIGIPTGANSGLVVIDVDGPAGEVSLAAREAELGELPVTAEQKTPHGRHLVFQHPGGTKNSAGYLGDSLDVRGDGGYIVVAPSGGYKWRRSTVRLTSPPAAWARRIAAPLVVVPPENGGSNGTTIPTIPEGKRNSALTRLAGKYRDLGWGAEKIEIELQQNNIELCITPLSAAEVSRIAASVASYPAGVGMVDAVVFAKAEPNGATAEPERPFGIPVREWAAQVPEAVEWVWEGYIARGDLVELDGAAKRSGKSTLIWHLVRAMRTGADYLGGATIRGHVVVLSEMAGSSLREQLEAADIIDAENLTLVPYNEWSGESWESIADRAIAACGKHSAALLVIDTLPKWAKIRENQGNSEGEWLERMQALESLHGSSTAVIALCHDRKSGGAVAESGAGSTARVGAMDTALRLSRIDGGDNSRNRKLEALGRHPDSPEQQTISLTPEGYITLGAESDAVKQWIGHEIREVMANNEPWTITGLKKATDGKDQTVRRAVEWLIDANLIYKTPGANQHEGATYKIVPEGLFHKAVQP